MKPQRKKRRLLEMAGIFHRSDKLLLEEEGEEEAGDAEPADAGDDAADEGGDTGGDEGGGGGGLFGDPGDDEDEDQPDEDEEEEPEEEEPEELSNDEIAKFGSGLMDAEMDQILSNAYLESIESGKVKSQISLGYPGEQSTEELEDKIEESISNYSLKYLMEAQELDPDFDLDHFTKQVAKYMKHYETLLDLEGMIFNKAKQFLLNQAGPEVADDFAEKLALVHGFDLNNEFDIGSEPQAPAAAGATTAGGGGGG